MSENHYSLSALNGLVKTAVKECFPSRYWVHAELSELREHSSGHCYLEFIEKEARSGVLIAKARGTIWSSAYRMIKPYFEKKTGQLLTSGIKVLVEVSLEFHELYGYSLTVHDIDPVYTLGDMALRRLEIIRQLTDEGVVDMNKSLLWNDPPQRIAVISSATAAGYGDFENQLRLNSYGYQFYIKLFPAVMQGVQTEDSLIAALDSIYAHQHLFDAVVIIRGGGATSDLTSFDSYRLALNITQFPLPVITGIGHERDDTVLDMVANVRAKTPTAAAEYLVTRLILADSRRIGFAHDMTRLVNERLQYESKRVHHLGQSIPLLAERMLLSSRNRLDRLTEQLKQFATYRIEKEQQKLEMMRQIVDLSSPYTILAKGYSLTLMNGRTIRSVDDLIPQGKLVTLVSDGEIESKIVEIIKTKI